MSRPDHDEGTGTPPLPGRVIALEQERSPAGANAASPEPAERWRPSVSAILVMVLAVGLLCGAAGFALGGRRDTPTAVDVGFLQDMVDHHEQAIVMGKILQTAGGTPEVRHFANEIVQSQTYEDARMLTWLEGWGRDRGEPDRGAMGWMGQPFPVAGMPGMATEADMTALQAASGRDADTLFVRMMIAHHLGGIGMADFAKRHAEDGRVREMAGRISRYQAVEIRELEAARGRIGLPA
ncbi:MAG: DUF305 domain-containing protein [Acidimicrobiales bacterium]